MPHTNGGKVLIPSVKVYGHLPVDEGCVQYCAHILFSSSSSIGILGVSDSCRPWLIAGEREVQGSAWTQIFWSGRPNRYCQCEQRHGIQVNCVSQGQDLTWCYSGCDR